MAQHLHPHRLPQSKIILVWLAENTKALLHIADTTFSKPRLLLLADGIENQAYIAKNSFLKSIAPLEGKATAYVCSDFTCKTPVTDPIALQGQLEENR